MPDCLALDVISGNEWPGRAASSRYAYRPFPSNATPPEPRLARPLQGQPTRGQRLRKAHSPRNNMTPSRRAAPSRAPRRAKDARTLYPTCCQLFCTLSGTITSSRPGGGLEQLGLAWALPELHTQYQSNRFTDSGQEK